MVNHSSGFRRKTVTHFVGATIIALAASCSPAGEPVKPEAMPLKYDFGKPGTKHYYRFSGKMQMGVPKDVLKKFKDPAKLLVLKKMLGKFPLSGHFVVSVAQEGKKTTLGGLYIEDDKTEMTMESDEAVLKEGKITDVADPSFFMTALPTFSEKRTGTWKANFRRSEDGDFSGDYTVRKRERVAGRECLKMEGKVQPAAGYRQSAEFWGYKLSSTVWFDPKAGIPVKVSLKASYTETTLPAKPDKPGLKYNYELTYELMSKDQVRKAEGIGDGWVLLTGGKKPVLSPTGQYMLFERGDTLWSMQPRAGAGAVDLGIPCHFSPSWSPDGKWVTFKGYRIPEISPWFEKLKGSGKLAKVGSLTQLRLPHDYIWIARADGGDVRPLWRKRSAGYLWSPDSQKVAVGTPSKLQVSIIPLDVEKKNATTFDVTGKLRKPELPRWTPDSQALEYHRNNVRLSLEGEKITSISPHLPPDATALRHSPDRKHLAYVVLKGEKTGARKALYFIMSKSSGKSAQINQGELSDWRTSRRVWLDADRFLLVSYKRDEDVGPATWRADIYQVSKGKVISTSRDKSKEALLAKFIPSKSSKKVPKLEWIKTELTGRNHIYLVTGKGEARK